VIGHEQIKIGLTRLVGELVINDATYRGVVWIHEAVEIDQRNPAMAVGPSLREMLGVGEEESVDGWGHINIGPSAPEPGSEPKLPQSGSNRRLDFCG
jgi:hypothetical protein